MNGIRILLADDDKVFCGLASSLLRRYKYDVMVATGVEDARKALAEADYDLMMLDMCFPALNDGFDLLDEVHKRFPKLVILMISGSGHIPDAVQAIKCGATDFIEKPLEPEHLLLRVNTLSERLLSEQKMEYLAKTSIGMIGVSKALQITFDSIIQAARFDSPVLITGETGVGKELAANAIHRLSRYSDKNMITINCASVPKELFEAELFGYEQGAFTGAVKSHRGYFEFADKTSFFLDEISELPMSLQAKLLRVISEGEIQKIGGRVQQVNTRIISASNQDLEKLVEDGSFRQDLFYRLNAIHINIPPLRSRKEDISVLAQFFLNEFCTQNKLPPKTLTPAALEWLDQQYWKGNARELKNCIEKGVIFATDDSLDVANFTTVCSQADIMNLERPESTLRQALNQYEKHLIEFYLQANNYNVSQTAEHLDIDKSNLFKKIKQHNISLPR